MILKKIQDMFVPAKTSRTDRQKSSQTSFYESLYPSDVRYALSYNEARVGKSEMMSLTGRFLNETVYLVVKAVAYDREVQRQYLEDLTYVFMHDDPEDDNLRALLRKYIDALPSDTTVTATKLAQLSRGGNETWQDAFRDMAESSYENDPDALPCIVAHTPMIGYRHFVHVFSRRHGAQLLLLMPTWIVDDDETYMGYEITLNANPKVIPQVKDECVYGTWTCFKTECPFSQRFCRKAVFFDDTINTGATSGKLQSFWHTEYGVNVPLDRIRVITHLSK